MCVCLALLSRLDRPHLRLRMCAHAITHLCCTVLRSVRSSRWTSCDAYLTQACTRRCTLSAL